MKILVFLGSEKTKPIEANLMPPDADKGSEIEEMVVVRLLINRIMAIYKQLIEGYYTRRKSRCSSMVEHSFRKAGVEGPTPSIGFIEAVLIFILSVRMSLDDTSTEAKEIQCRLYRNMTIAQKAQRVFSAYRIGKMLNMAGIRMNHTDASEEQV